MSATLYVTVGTRQEAEALAEAAVEARLAACANIFAIHSVYRWEGQLHAEGEHAMFFKTRAELTRPLMSFISDRHSYDCPCMVVLPWEGAHPPYAQWVAEATSAPAGE